MLAEIETKIKDYLEQVIREPKRTDIQAAHKAFALPQIDVVVGGGKFKKVGQKHQLAVSVYVVITFQNLRSEQDRRHGIYPIVEGIAAHLTGRRFGLNITSLMPQSVDNITNQEEAQAGKVLFQIPFETAFEMPIAGDENNQSEDLLRIGINYYLQPSDEGSEAEPDVSDLLTLQEG